MKPFKSKPLPKAAEHTTISEVDEPTETPQKSPSEFDMVKEKYEGIELHKCECKTQPGGYGHLVSTCVEDYKGYLWLIGNTGRRMSMVRFCPFCGFQALNEPEELTTVDGDPEMCSELTTPNDKPNRVWRRFSEPYKMEHFQFGIVRVHATDGCHAKVKAYQFKEIITVCVENLHPIRGIPTMPKVGEKETKSSKPKKEVDIAAMAKKYEFL